ncbi:hypothetical protein ACS0TY_032989 [Phlomoides rotata]
MAIYQNDGLEETNNLIYDLTFDSPENDRISGRRRPERRTKQIVLTMENKFKCRNIPSSKNPKKKKLKFFEANVAISGRAHRWEICKYRRTSCNVLSILGHHEKNRVVKFDHKRSGHTISHYIHLILRSVLQVHNVLLVRPTPVTSEFTNPHWKWFKLYGCLCTLDGTYINVRVPAPDKGRYRISKGQIFTNVLDVCDRELCFVYVLPGWEGSACDAHVLRDFINRVNGLKVLVGNKFNILHSI